MPVYRADPWDFYCTLICISIYFLSFSPSLSLSVAVSPQLLWEGVGTIRNRQSGKQGEAGRERGSAVVGPSQLCLALYSLSIYDSQMFVRQILVYWKYMCTRIRTSRDARISKLLNIL